MLGFGRSMMSERDFWAVIEVMRGEVDEEALERLGQALGAMKRIQVVAFHQRLVERLHELDREALAGAAGPCPLSWGNFIRSTRWFRDRRFAIAAC